MRKNYIMAMAAGMAGLLGMGQTLSAASSPRSENTRSVKDEYKAPMPGRRSNHRIVNEIGGMPLMQVGGGGMSPKQYGMSAGNGKSKGGKTNFLRLKHNAKLKRR